MSTPTALRIILSLSLHGGYGREVARGVRDYVPRQPWFIKMDQSGLEYAPAVVQGWRPHGIIAQYGARAQEDALLATGVPVVNVSAPTVNVANEIEAPVVNVAPASVTIEHTNATPVVNVQVQSPKAAPSTEQVTRIAANTPRTGKVTKRDLNGRIAEFEIEDRTNG